MTREEAQRIVDAAGGRAALIERFNDGYLNHQKFCSRLKIYDKLGVLRTPDWHGGWERMARLVERQHKAGKPVRILDLKSRQAHHSAGWCTHVFKRVAFVPGQHARVFCDLHKNASNLQRYTKTYADYYEPGPLGMPTIGECVENKSEHRLAWPGDSWVEFESAENATGGRSAAVRHLICDEFGFWRDAETLMTGLLQSVPDDPDTFIVINSTANGAGGPFYDRWKTYSEPGYKGEWIAAFFPWFEHAENTLPLRDIPRFQDSLTREEINLQHQFNLRLQQLHWRRWAIANKCDGSLEKFHQEHPGTAEEAFLTSGRPRFCLISLGRMVASRDAQVGELERRKIGSTERITLVPAVEGGGAIQVFKWPAQGRLYVIGADPSEGIDDGAIGKSDPDYGAACVLDQDTGEQVAAARVRLEPDPFADLVATLAEWYNWAFLVPEINSVGLAFVQALLYRNYPVHLIYHREREPDDRRPAMLQELGWKQTEITRQQLISNHDRMIRELAIMLRCPVTLGEHQTFVVKATGRAEHQEGCHDDTVFAAALASIGLQVAPRIRALFEAKRKPVHLDPDDEDDRKPVSRYGIGRRYR